MTAFATADDMIARFDVRTLGDLVGDAGTRMNATQLQADANLQAALDDAAGEILDALTQNDRYSEDDLDSLTGRSQNTLKRMNVAIAMGYLSQRRPWADDPVRSRFIESADEARALLEDFRLGKKVLTTEAADAGLPESETPPLSIVTPLNLTVDRARLGYYLSRELPTV